MYLILKDDNTPHIKAKDWEMSAGEFIDGKRLQKGMSTSSLEAEAGIEHPTLWRLLQGTNKSLLVVLRTLDALGYKIKIIPSKELE